MIEAVAVEGGWTWRIISAEGRLLAYSNEVFPCECSAARAANAARQSFWGAAQHIDHRQGKCI